MSGLEMDVKAATILNTFLSEVYVSDSWNVLCALVSHCAWHVFSYFSSTGTGMHFTTNCTCNMVSTLNFQKSVIKSLVHPAMDSTRK